MEEQKCTISIFSAMLELERQGFAIGTVTDTVLVPTQVILGAQEEQAGGSATWDKNAQYTTISTVQYIWMLEILRKYAIDIHSRYLRRVEMSNTAQSVIFSPQIHIQSTGIRETTGMLLSVEPLIVSGGECLRVYVRRVTLKDLRVLS